MEVLEVVVQDGMRLERGRLLPISTDRMSKALHGVVHRPSRAGRRQSDGGVFEDVGLEAFAVRRRRVVYVFGFGRRLSVLNDSSGDRFVGGTFCLMEEKNWASMSYKLKSTIPLIMAALKTDMLASAFVGLSHNCAKMCYENNLIMFFDW